MLTAVAGLGGIAYFGANDTRERVQVIGTKSIPSIVASDYLAQSILRVRISQARQIMASRPEERKAADSDRIMRAGQVDEARQQIAALALAPDEKAAFAEFERLWSDTRLRAGASTAWSPMAPPHRRPLFLG